MTVAFCSRYLFSATRIRHYLSYTARQCKVLIVVLHFSYSRSQRQKTRTKVISLKLFFLRVTTAESHMPGFKLDRSVILPEPKLPLL
jgi:hypothetical protein